MNAESIEKWTKALFIALGTILTVYIAFSTLGYVSNSKVHYANFALGIMVLSSLYGVQNLFDEFRKEASPKKTYFSDRISDDVQRALLGVGAVDFDGRSVPDRIRMAVAQSDGGSLSDAVALSELEDAASVSGDPELIVPAAGAPVRRCRP